LKGFFMTSTATSHVFTVIGMSCGHCEKAVSQAIRQLDPVADVQIDRTAQRVEVTSTKNQEELAQVIREEGYEVKI
jgi:copper chaperone